MEREGYLHHLGKKWIGDVEYIVSNGVLKSTGSLAQRREEIVGTRIEALDLNINEQRKRKVG